MQKIEIIEIIELMFVMKSTIIVAIIVVGVFVISFLIISGKNSKKEALHALGLPVGSIRAILALTLVVSVIFMALYFSFRH